MTSVEQTRERLGPVGALVGVGRDAPAMPVQQAAVRRLDAAGWPVLWTNEIVGTDALVRASLWLAASPRVVVGTCVANVWARPPQTAHAAATQLAQAHPGRFALGLGVGNPDQAAAVGRDYGSPAAVARAYLDATTGGGYPRLLGANGPRLLAVAGRHADGALPAGRPPADTAVARAAVGADALLVVLVPLSGTEPAAEVAGTVAEHRAAGADHVIVGRGYGTDFAAAVDHLDTLAPVVLRRDAR